MPTSLEILTQINLDDLVSSFGWQNQPWLARLLRRTFIKPARTFASQMADFDSPIATHGLAEASRLTLQHYVRDIRIFGADRIPAGAFLALSNHPGMSDTLSLFVALKRPDLKIIAFDRPFLNALPNVSKQLFYLTDDPASRITLIRQMSTHLKNGGAALTFPGAHIEPDPDVHDGALDSLTSWTSSAGVFIRLAPETAVLPVLVRGVVWKKTAYHPLTYLKRTRAEREKLAGALQLLAHAMWSVRPVTVRVQIGKPIYASELGTTETQAIHQAVLAEMKELIMNPPEGQGESAI
ncbi:MAG: glycerol acyltransferase [Anaerolineales bacterium]